MIALGVLLALFGIMLIIMGNATNNDAINQLESFFNNGTTNPGDVYIIIGITLIIVGVILVIVGFYKDKDYSDDDNESSNTPYYTQNYYCPNCGSKIPKDSRFCNVCGYDNTTKEETLKCHYCGATIPSKSKFCLECGKTVIRDSDTIICKNCGNKIPAKSKFCLECGIVIKSTLTCQKCGTENDANNLFCMNCGSSLTQPPQKTEENNE